MKKIAALLIDFGFEFTYINQNSNGERIAIPLLDLDIYTHQGQIFYERKGKAKILEETERNYDVVLIKLKKRLIKETT